MATIVIEPSALLRGTASDGLDRLVEDLGQQRHVVTLASVPERRDLRQAAADVVIHVLEAIEAHALDALIAALVARLIIRRRNRPRRAVIYGPDGEVLREVELGGDGDPG
jgi:hypothetical protein